MESIWQIKFWNPVPAIHTCNLINILLCNLLKFSKFWFSVLKWWVHTGWSPGLLPVLKSTFYYSERKLISLIIISLMEKHRVSIQIIFYYSICFHLDSLTYVRLKNAEPVRELTNQRRLEGSKITQFYYSVLKCKHLHFINVALPVRLMTHCL